MTDTHPYSFDWTAATERHREALLRIVSALMAMAGLADDKATLPRHLRNRLLRILRPAESAARRLIVVAALRIEVAVRLSGKRKDPPPGSVILGFDPKTSEAPSLLARTHSVKPASASWTKNLPLVDPRKRFDFAPRRRYAKTFPRITCIGLSEPAPAPDGRFPSPDDELDATRLCARIRALKAALDDIPGQAKRLARREARRDLHNRQPDRKSVRLSPMRPGWPPGYRKRARHEVDEVLRECHSLAVWALKPPDTG